MRGRHVFMWQSLKILNAVYTLTLKQVFWKTQTPFKKLEYSFVVKSTKIGNATFPYKTALSEDNVNRMWSTKWTYLKERSFTSNYFISIFPKILFHFKNLVQRINLMYQPPKRRYSYFSKSLDFYFRVLFPCGYP